MWRLPQRQPLTKLNKPPDMKRAPAMKNSEKIWKLEYLESVSNQEPNEQNKIKDNEIQDQSTLFCGE